jgi:hypothetical protein
MSSVVVAGMRASAVGVIHACLLLGRLGGVQFGCIVSRPLLAMVQYLLVLRAVMTCAQR